jgi:hypothetical protein
MGLHGERDVAHSFICPSLNQNRGNTAPENHGWDRLQWLIASLLTCSDPIMARQYGVSWRAS